MYQRLTLTETAVRLRGNEPTLILFHRHPDGDAIGAGFGLKLILEAMGCTAYCVCEDEIPERLRFLTEGVQDSILKENLPADFAPTQIISVDTASPAQAGVLYPDYEGKFDLMIDHHAKGDMYADGYIDGEASSAGELIYRLSRELVRIGLLSAIPEGVDSDGIVDMILVMAERIKSGTGSAGLTKDIIFEKALYQASCKAAIKAGREYSKEQIKRIVDKLMEIPDITVCPHGRPVAMILDKKNLDRQFERT